MEKKEGKKERKRERDNNKERKIRIQVLLEFAGIQNIKRFLEKEKVLLHFEKIQISRENMSQFIQSFQ